MTEPREPRDRRHLQPLPGGSTARPRMLRLPTPLWLTLDEQAAVRRADPFALLHACLVLEGIRPDNKARTQLEEHFPADPKQWAERQLPPKLYRLLTQKATTWDMKRERMAGLAILHIQILGS